jgi:hypothetical protein
VATTFTETDFERLSWHDCHVWRLALHAGDPDAGDWTSDLVLDLDYIVEWLCAVDGGARFRVAPATLVFHGVTDPRLAVDWGSEGHQTAVHEMAIDGIVRERLAGQRVYLDRPYYRWTVRLNWPAGGELAFGAVGFTQTLLAEPVELATPSLSPLARRRLLGT